MARSKNSSNSRKKTPQSAGGSGQQNSDEHDRLAQPVDREEGPRLPFPVVGIGASAGGLEAFIEFFDAMPKDPGIAFVLVQHLPPDRESMITEILRKHTPLPIDQVEEGMVVEPNHVYVIRPGRTLTIKNGRLHLGERLEKPGHNRPVDDFFRSLAEEQRERSICIVMSGMGSNGSQGTEVIKAVGGMAIAQEPESAKYPSMPRHLLESGNADYVLRPGEMPEALIRYAAEPYVRSHLWGETEAEDQDRNISEILSILHTRTRRDFAGYKRPTVIRRIQRRMGLNHIATLEDYAKFLRQTPQEVSSLADDMMIHVTGFFRDAEAWDALLKHSIMPLVNERHNGSTIRCWVSACASGEEAYTLSMLLSEAADAAGKTFDVKVFATDTADRALARARSGIYPLGIESEVAPERLERFFERHEAVYRVKKELREMVVFAPQNVIQDPPFSRLDICSCRNLLIYLEPDLQRRVLGLLHFGLREGGYLFLGSSETVIDPDGMFVPVDKRARIYRRIGRPGTLTINSVAEGLTRKSPSSPTVDQLTTQSLLHQFAPTAVTVNEEGELVYVHGDASSFLTIPPGTATNDLASMVHASLQPAVRNALFKARKTNAPVTARGTVVKTPKGDFHLEVTVAPLEGEGAPGHSVVSFKKLPEPPKPPTTDAFETHTEAELRAEINRMRDELQTTIEELQSGNEEMQATNEETMSVNEELQSTNEELQTSKEELQSLNEELTTVNAQLEAKMEELEATTNDLSSVLTSTDIAVIFLDSKLRIRRFTPATKDLFDLIPSDVGRPMTDMASKFSDPNLVHDCRAVLDKLIPIERETRSTSGRVYVRRVLPYRTTDNRIDGVVITFIDITGRKLAEEALGESEERFRLVIDNAPDFAMLLIDPQGKIVTWNIGAERLLGWTATEAVGKSATIIFPPETGKSQAQQEMERAAEFGRAADEGWHVRKSGARFWGSGVLTAIHDDSGIVTGFVKVLRDDTARKQAEADRAAALENEQSARREAENATRLKDQFLATLSHELRTPLSSVLVWAKMLRQNLLTPGEQEEGLEVIERSAEAQKELLDDLLDTSRIAAGKVRLDRTDSDLRDIVKVAIDDVMPQAKDKNIKLGSRLATDIGAILADPHRLRQVANNLLGNAVKFTPSGGRIDVQLTKSEGWVELVVADTGRGIDPDFVSQVFIPFSQADTSTTRAGGGLGLGLAICKELIELHGGTIHAESKGRDQGATFIVRLPMLAAPKSEKRKDAKRHNQSDSAERLNGVQVLWVEDEPQTRDALVRLLSKNGAQVTAVSTAAEAFDAFKKSRPDVIVSDIGLPGEDGYQLLQRIRQLELEKHESATPAIALTAFASNKDRRQAREAGFHKHLAKPVTPAALLAALSTLMSEKDRHDNGG
jgi:two-component system CheB/CheR fusion protein